MIREGSNRLLNELFSKFDEGILIYSPKGDIILMNAAARDLLGIPEGDSEFENWKDYCDLFDSRTDELLPGESWPHEQVMKTGSILTSEIRIVPRNGSDSIVNVTGEMITDAAGNEVALIIRLRDLSVRQHIETDSIPATERSTDSRMSAVDVELESFIYSVSHDLQAPLRHIKGFSALLADEYTELLEGGGSDYIERVHQACDRMQQQLLDLLRLSRNTRGRMFPSRINLGDIARAVLDEFQQRQPDRQVKISISGNLEAEGDQRLILIMMRHLLDNAWKFTRERDPAEISFGVQQADGNRIFSIRDNGTGFDRSMADKLFLPFRRYHGDEYEGNGIGLASALRIINRHGGKIWIESEPDCGTTCFFTLPG